MTLGRHARSSQFRGVVSLPRVSSRGVSKTLVALVLALSIPACAESRPEATEWLSQWNSVVGLVPERESLEEPVSSEVCDTVLASLRSSSDTLSLTPDEVIDEPVRSWIKVAEGAFFECPPDEPGGFQAAYDELERLESAVRSALEPEDG